MNKVLIDRELAERVCHVDNSTRQTARRELRTILATPSGTPAMPVKAYYHEAPNEYGGLNKSVGLEIRKEFTDAPLVLESDALAQIACLEGEIAKRDARIVELQNDASYYAARNEELRAKLAAPVSEAKAQVVVMPERANASHGSHDHQSGWNACLDEVARLNAAHAQQAVPDGFERYEVFPYLDDDVAELDICESDDGTFVKYDDAQAIIDGLRGEVDQQAKRIGELASHLEFAVTLLTVAGLAGNAQVEAMRATLSAGNEPKQCT